MTKQEKSEIINLLRLEIKVQQQLTVIRQMLNFYFHGGQYDIAELEECERLAQEQEL